MTEQEATCLNSGQHDVKSPATEFLTELVHTSPNLYKTEQKMTSDAEAGNTAKSAMDFQDPLENSHQEITVTVSHFTKTVPFLLRELINSNNTSLIGANVWIYPLRYR